MKYKFNVKRRVAEVGRSYRNLIKNADSQTLRRIAKSSFLGVRLSETGQAFVCLLQDDLDDAQVEKDNLVSSIETPIHELTISDQFRPFSMEGCKQWLDSYGLNDCDIAELEKSYSGTALERRVENMLFRHPGVIFTLKWEMLVDIDDDLLEEYYVTASYDAMDEDSKLLLDYM